MPIAPLPSILRISYLPMRPERTGVVGFGSAVSLIGAPGGWLSPRRTLGTSRSSRLAGDGEVRAAVTRPALLRLLLAEGHLLAIGDRLQAIRGHAESDDVVVGGARAA